MKIKKNGQVIKLTESDLKRIVKRVLNEDDKRCKPLSHISVMDMADRSNLVKIPNGTSEFNLLDDEQKARWKSFMDMPSYSYRRFNFKSYEVPLNDWKANNGM